MGGNRLRGKDGERHYIYHVRRVAKIKDKNLLPLKSEIFQAWLDKDNEAQEAQEEGRDHNPSGTVQKSPYSLNPYSKISGQDEISGQTSQSEPTDSNFDPEELAALIVCSNAEQLKRLRTEYYSPEQINQAWKLLTAEEKQNVHRAAKEAC